MVKEHFQFQRAVLLAKVYIENCENFALGQGFMKLWSSHYGKLFAAHSCPREHVILDSSQSTSQKEVHGYKEKYFMTFRSVRNAFYRHSVQFRFHNVRLASKLQNNSTYRQQ